MREVKWICRRRGCLSQMPPCVENMRVSQARTLVIRATLCLAVIACGLGLRAYGLGWGLPAAIVKYGGSILWGTMVFLLVTLAAPRLARPQAMAIAAVIA